ncbi:hypothetical protein, partial [Novosphingobium sp.]|uniref:hypothetical protein n=1 Tax=Novosphingobium sp. TaxID=1874826 RepID=UPI002FE390E0
QTIHLAVADPCSDQPGHLLEHSFSERKHQLTPIDPATERLDAVKERRGLESFSTKLVEKSF